MQNRIRIGIVDDHKLFCNALADHISLINNCEVVLKASDGEDFFNQLRSISNRPDIVLMDVNMRPMNGVEATHRLHASNIGTLVIALSMHNDDQHILAMLKAGARGYLLKNTSLEELKLAFRSVLETGYYFSDLTTGALDRNSLQNENEPVFFSAREKEFIRHLCDDLSYKEIGTRMFISGRSVEHYRDNILKKLGVKSKIGIVVYAIKNKLWEA